jgi:hypothetical protein
MYLLNPRIYLTAVGVSSSQRVRQQASLPHSFSALNESRKSKGQKEDSPPSLQSSMMVVRSRGYLNEFAESGMRRSASSPVGNSAPSGIYNEGGEIEDTDDVNTDGEQSEYPQGLLINCYATIKSNVQQMENIWVRFLQNNLVLKPKRITLNNRKV